MPLLGPMVTSEVHCDVLGLLGISAERREMEALTSSYGADGVDAYPFLAWWEKVSRMKGIAQWQSKLASLGSTERPATMSHVGVHLYRHLSTAGIIASLPLQSAPRVEHR